MLNRGSLALRWVIQIFSQMNIAGAYLSTGWICNGRMRPRSSKHICWPLQFHLKWVLACCPRSVISSKSVLGGWAEWQPNLVPTQINACCPRSVTSSKSVLVVQGQWPATSLCLVAQGQWQTILLSPQVSARCPRSATSSKSVLGG